MPKGKPRRIKKLGLSEISGVDVPAMPDALAAIQKSYTENKPPQLVKAVDKAPALEPLAKAMSVDLSLYVWDVRDQFDYDWNVANIERLYNQHLPFVAQWVQMQGEELGLELTTDGPFASILEKSIEKHGDYTKQGDDTMSDSEKLSKALEEVEALKKENKELKEASAKSDTPEAPEVEKSTDERVAALEAEIAKRDEADSLRKQADELLPGYSEGTEAAVLVVKTANGIEDEKAREAFLTKMRNADKLAGKATVAKGDSGSETTEKSAADEYEQLIKAYQKEHPGVSGIEAANAVKQSNPNLVKRLAYGDDAS